MLREASIGATMIKMRCLALLPMLLAACQAPHVDLRLQLACDPTQTDPPPPKSCQAMSLGCANFIETRLYAWQGGQLGDILQSSCMTAAQLGSPIDLCALESRAGALTLLKGLPKGASVRFRLRALFVANPADGCNVDVFVSAKNQVVFDGFSDPVTVDDRDHLLTLALSTCGSCLSSLVVVPSMGCQIGAFDGGTCECATPPGSPGCLAAGAACPDGEVAQLVAGGCCARCPNSSAP
jgi:hypothetical protein